MKALNFNHPEELTNLWPEMQKDTSRRQGSKGVGPWWAAPGPKYGGGTLNSGAGYGTFFVKSPRNQKVLVKAASNVNRAPGTWYGHGIYLQREGANKEGEIGRGFDQKQDTIDLKMLLADWQRAGDRHFFKMIISPEKGNELDLKEFTRRTMAAIEKDLGKPLQWAAIDHHNTKHPHVHVALRGVSQEQRLTIARHYLRDGGMRERAQEVATGMLGPRTRREMDLAQERAVQSKAWSQLDQSIKTKIDKRWEVTDVALTSRERERMEALEERGLAWREGERWSLSFNWEAKQMDDRGISRKPQEHIQEQDTKKPEEQQKERTERETEEQHRRAVVVDEVEQEMGWGR